jgi:hypothetical protein
VGILAFRDDDKDAVLSELRPVDHDMVKEETCHFPCTCASGVWLKLGIVSFDHLLTSYCSQVDVDRKDDEYLKWVGASKRGFV